MKFFYLMFKLLTIIGMTEIVMMVALNYTVSSPMARDLIDSFFLPVAAAPMIYWFVIRDIQREFSNFIAFESLILSLSNRFIDPKNIRVEQEIETALRQIGEFLKIDSVSFMLFSPNGFRIQEVHQWSSHPIFSNKLAFLEMDLRSFDWFMGELDANRPVMIDTTHSLPEHAKNEQAVMAKLNMKSLLVLPVHTRGTTLGFLSFGSYSRPVTWSLRDKTLLGVAGEMFTNLLIRQRENADLRKLSTALEHAADNIIITDVNGIIEYVNRAFETYTGYTREEALGKRPNIIKSDRMPISYYEELWQTITAGRSFNGTVINRRKNGELYYEEKSITPLINANGVITHFVSTGKNVTKQKELENELLSLNANLQHQVEEEIAKRHQSFRLLENIYKGSIIGIVLADTSGTILEANPGFARMLGYDPEELVGMSFGELTHPDDLNRNAELFAQVLSGETDHYSMQKRYIAKDGRIVWGKLIVRTIKNGSDIDYILAMVEDITEIVAMEETNRVREELMTHQSKMAAMGEMIGAIAHQWRQPLNALNLILQDLEDAQAYNELDAAYLGRSVGKSKEQITFMSKTIDDFRNFFKPSKEKVAFCIEEKIDEVFGIIESQIRHNDITIRFDRPKESTEVFGLANEFKQVVLNIVNNAKDALIASREEARRIDVSVSCDATNFIVVIHDNAGGIPEGIMETLFEPYVTTKGESGTGVGLHIAKIIIEEHMEGRLTAHNDDEGATFTITLPR